MDNFPIFNSLENGCAGMDINKVSKVAGDKGFGLMLFNDKIYSIYIVKEST